MKNMCVAGWSLVPFVRLGGHGAVEVLAKGAQPEGSDVPQ